MRMKLFRKVRRLICLIHLGHSTGDSTNDLRYHLFLKKRKKILWAVTSMRKCSFYRTSIWRKCLTNLPTFPDPQSCRCFNVNHVLHVMWMPKLRTPEAVLMFTACKCRKECTMSSCQCMIDKLKCTAACTHREILHYYDHYIPGSTHYEYHTKII